LRFTAGLKKFYRGNNTISWVTIADENLTFVMAQQGWSRALGGLAALVRRATCANSTSLTDNLCISNIFLDENFLKTTYDDI
jgi:hypothetical protein